MMHGPLNVEFQTDSKVLMAATVFKFKTEQYTKIVKQEIAHSSKNIKPLCVTLQKK
jgi:hypothetical protein